ncbi:MAG: hypothetical protein E7181_02275 [Erysipelotrichaceae bacterium]|nr:hypothetical protein [Erysipelotrichaceae bacterium]
MSAFFGFLGETIRSIFQGRFFPNDISTIYAAYSSDFGVPGVILFVVLIILLVALAVALLIFIFLGLKKLFRRRPKGYDEKKMMEEIERLNLELYDVTREKDRILSLSREADGIYAPSINAGGGTGGGGSGQEVINGGRFAKLYVVDNKYKEGNFITNLPDDSQNISLKEICERFRNFACSQMKLYYSPEVVRQFFSAMGTGHLIILEGISGTGKTSLPYCMGRFLRHQTAICSVQPSWRDRSELLGYYNDFTKKFTETEFLRAVYEATYRNDVSVVVLDEMNLARVEYYFAEFLSIMEMPDPDEWIVDVIASGRDDDPKHLNNGKLLIPQNIWFVGTANNDDSTFTITDKVYDRAVSLFFDNKAKPFDAPYTEGLEIPAEYLLGLYKKAISDNPVNEDLIARFGELDEFVIEHFKTAFGNRIMKQIYSFIPVYVACGGTDVEALDFLFKTKVLKKFEVLSVGLTKDELYELDEELTRLFGANEFMMSRDKIAQLVKIAR